MNGNFNIKSYDRVRSYNNVVALPEELKVIEKYAFCTNNDRFLINLTEEQYKKFHEILRKSGIKVQVDNFTYGMNFEYYDVMTATENSLYGVSDKSKSIKKDVEEIGL